MNNACPGCGAVYNVTAKDIGRHLKCKKCGTPMYIGEDGIEPEGTGPAAMPAAEVDDRDDPAPIPRRRSRNINPAELTEVYNKYGGLIATGIFGAGAFLIIFHLFMPLIGQAKVAARRATIADEERYYTAEKDRINKDKDIKDKTKQLEELDKRHESEQKSNTDRLNSALSANEHSQYWDRYFMMFGFLLVMVGSLMFMMPTQPPVKRVVGAIVVTAQMVLVFIVFLGLSAASK